MELDDFAQDYESYVETALEDAWSMYQELDDYGDISDSLIGILYKYDASVHFYGSRVVGIANEESDLDIFVSVDEGPNLPTRNAYYNGRPKKEQIKILELLRTNFFQDPDWSVEKSQISYKATVPILYAHYLPRDLHCEIAVRDGRPVATSELLHHLFCIQPQAKSFFQFVRLWFKNAGIKLKGFQITLLVVFYLQQHNFMPSIERLQRNIPLEEVCGWPVEFNPQRNICDYGCKKLRDYCDLLSGFFSFYAEFDYGEDVIFPYSGETVEKDNYPDQECLQNFPGDIVNFKWQSPMAMAGLFSFESNVTLSIKQKKLDKFIKICESAEDNLNYYEIY